MSVNQIDVNAVNERTRNDTAGSTKAVIEDEDDGIDHAKLAEYSMFIRGSLKYRLAYRLIKVIMVFESIVWTLMDLLRGWRMRLVARINSNYQKRK